MEDQDILRTVCAADAVYVCCPFQLSAHTGVLTGADGLKLAVGVVYMQYGNGCLTGEDCLACQETHCREQYNYYCGKYV